MAKKNLASLMSGLMGDSSPMDASADGNASEVTQEMKDNLAAERKRNVGRPRKDQPVEKNNEIRATFIVDPELIRKVKYISLVDGSLLKTVINDALTAYIADWESRNGEIRLPNGK